ncbi:MAG: erythromycin esterase family protein [Aureispira sp.]
MKLKTFLSLCFLLLAQHNWAQIDIPIPQQVPIKEKWASLGKILAKKRIVALGENYHGCKEFNGLKVEMIQYLHEEMGFNVLALEGDLAMTYFANAYRDSLNDTLILKQALTPVWHTQHHLELIQYVKARPKLQLIGFDMLDQRPVSFFSKALGIAIDSNRADFQTFLKTYPQWEEVNGNHGRYSIEKRDSVMADIVTWIAEEIYPEEKIILSAHNFHIANDVPLGRVGMGTFLHQKYKKRYYSIGFFNSLGDPVHIFRNRPYDYSIDQLPKNSLQYKLLQKQDDLLFIPISQQKRSKENKWFHQEIYNFTHPKYSTDPIILCQYFDGLVWVRTVTSPNFVIKSKVHEKTFY